MLGAQPVSFEVDGEKRWFVPLIDYCRLERRVEELELKLSGSVGPFQTPQKMFEDDMRRICDSTSAKACVNSTKGD